MSDFHNYDPGKVIFNFGLLPMPISGYAEGTFIKVRRKEDGWKSKGGADGETTRIQNRNRQGEIEIVLKQGSQSNAMLSVIANLDEQLGNQVAPASVMDMSGQDPKTAAATLHAWLRKIPDGTFAGQDEETRTWIFDTGSLDIFIGGN